jgi:Cu2+-exporting ATPase
VIAFPDAVGLATLTAGAVRTGLGAKPHMVINDTFRLEGSSRIRAVVLDKTGT